MASALTTGLDYNRQGHACAAALSPALAQAPRHKRCCSSKSITGWAPAKNR
jgi:hypothetical protein